MVAKPACERDGTDVLEVTDLTRTIARALACDPILLLMDEPFGSVDAQTREDLEDLTLRVRAESGITILVVTHDIDESVYVGDRVIVLTPGARAHPGRSAGEPAAATGPDREQGNARVREAAGRGQPAGAQPRHGRRAAVRVVAAVAPGRPGSAAAAAGLSRRAAAGLSRRAEPPGGRWAEPPG